MDIERWHVALIEQRSPRTIRAAHGLLQRVLADGMRHGVLHRNVARDQGAPALPKPAAVAMPDAEQVKELLAKLVDDPWRVPSWSRSTRLAPRRAIGVALVER